MKTRKVSIIIPIYNAEKYLEQCINSIINQTYHNLEIILVDDGSNDSSLRICNHFANKDNRIKVISNMNQGVSCARNIGIENATGFYVQFIDSDDYIESKMTQKLVELLENNKADIGICGFQYINKENNEMIPFIKDYGIYPTRVFPIKKFLKHLGYFMTYVNNICTPWNKLFIASTIKSNKIYFDQEIEYGEDLLFNLKYLRYCKKIVITNDILYNYVIYNLNSLETKYKKELFYTILNQYTEIKKLLKDFNAYTKYNSQNLSNYFLERTFHCIRMVFHKDCKINDIEKVDYIKKILEDKYVHYAAEHRAYNLDGWLSCIPELILSKEYDKIYRMFSDESKGIIVSFKDKSIRKNSLNYKIIRYLRMFNEVKLTYGFFIAAKKAVKVTK